MINLLLYQTLAFTIHGKKFKNHTKIINICIRYSRLFSQVSLKKREVGLSALRNALDNRNISL